LIIAITYVRVNNYPFSPMAQRELNEEQRKAVEHGNGPLLIIAGAGTGKTTVVTERINHLIIDEKIPPQNILALTFTDKAAYEMQDRVDKLMPYGYTNLWIHTFHSFCDRVLRDDAHNIGLDPNYKLISEAESILMMRQNIFDLGLEVFRPLGNPTKFLDALLVHFSRLKDEDITPDEYINWAEKQATEEEKEQYKELAKAYKKYEELKIKNSVMDFSDLISNTLLMLRSRKTV
jgi:DNA helicase II / ATP-dependent DNA helicase PcrA